MGAWSRVAKQTHLSRRRLDWKPKIIPRPRSKTKAPAMTLSRGPRAKLSGENGGKGRAKVCRPRRCSRTGVVQREGPSCRKGCLQRGDGHLDFTCFTRRREKRGGEIANNTLLEDRRVGGKMSERLDRRGSWRNGEMLILECVMPSAPHT